MKFLVLLFVLCGFVVDAMALDKGPDNRRTEADPNDPIEQWVMDSSVRVFGVGNGVLGSGNLVMSRRLLVTNYHVLYDHEVAGTVKRAEYIYVQLDPKNDSYRVLIDWNNIRCSREYDTCAVELKEAVPNSRSIGILQPIADEYLNHPSSLGAVYNAAFSYEGNDIEISRNSKAGGSQRIELTSLLEAQLKIKKIQKASARDWDGDNQFLLLDTDIRLKNSGSANCVNVNDKPYMASIAVFQLSFSSKMNPEQNTKNGEPYSKERNATVSFPVNDVIYSLVTKVYGQI